MERTTGGRRDADLEQEAVIELLRIANESRGVVDLIRSATSFLVVFSGCESAGVRLGKGDDYPYFESRGFGREFLEAENRLCERDETGKPVLDEAGSAVLSCMCGNVIRGRFDPSLPFFTKSGSFWSNCTTELLASTSDAERQARTRNRCNGEGYESVALIPLRSGSKCLGLLQLNSRSKNRFSLERIAVLEKLANHLSLGLAKALAEESIAAALREKETLLKEIHHRVKNNLMVVSSLLNLQGSRIPDAAVRTIFEESQQRIRSMALVHEKLCGTRDLSRIDLADYVRSLLDAVIAIMRHPGGEIAVRIDIGDVMLDVDAAVPCGLILNELVTNALKYAFKGRERGELAISVTAEGERCILSVKDDGVGLPEGFDPHRTNTLGLKIVDMLASQLDGEATFRSGDGTEAVVTFTRHGGNLGDG